MGTRTRTHLRAFALLALWAAPAFAQQSAWTSLGPAPATNGQVEGIANQPVAGAIHAVAPHPSDAAILYVGAVNGGVWKTTNATAASPAWTRLTDTQLSNAIGDLTFDPTDATRNTLVAGVARYSSFGGAGGRRIGVLRTTDGGANWTRLGTGITGLNISGVAARGNVIVAAADFADTYSCATLGMYRSTDTGASFTKLPLASGLPPGPVDALAGDPTNPDVLYASVALANFCTVGAVAGIYKSVDAGATWAKVSSAAIDAALDNTNGDSSDNVRIAVASASVVAVAIARGNLLGVFHSTTGGASWTSMSLPSTLEGASAIGLHPGGQGSLHLSLAVDPVNTNLVYVGGDRQPLSGASNFPNSSGAFDFSGRLFRGDVTLAPALQWTRLTHSGAANNSAPHADSREMAFDAAGRLLEADDGGLYARLDPRLPTGAWISVNGDLQINEQHSAVFDPVSNVALSGNQDTGTTRQVTPGNRTWASLHTGDGGDVEIDSRFLAAQNQSIGYSSFQNLQLFRRLVFDAGNTPLSGNFPLLSVTSGPAFVAQFATPVAGNQATGGRLVFGGANGVYESLNRGDSIAQVPSDVAGNGVRVTSNGADNIGYGAAGNLDALYVGGCLTPLAGPSFPCIGGTFGVYRRFVAGSPLVASYIARAGSQINGVTLDADDVQHVFAIESSSGGARSRVLRSTNNAGSFADVTGNLPAGIGELRSVLYVPHPTNDLVVVGGEAGIYVTSRARGFTSWTALGTGLPVVPVYDLSYDAVDDVLHAGTLGRGSFSLARVASRPLTVPDTASTQAGTAVVVDVLANDSDVGGALDVATVVVAPPPNGSTSADPATGAVTYTPNPGFVGDEVFSYRVSDDLGTQSNVSLVTIRVNAPPVAVADAVVAQRDTPLAIDVLANDQDLDGALDPATVTIVAQPADGSATAAATGIVTFTPSPGFGGDTSFTYTVRDDEGVVSNVATVSVSVNAAPVASDDVIAVAIGGTAASLAGGATSLLANDSDADGDSLVVTATPGTAPQRGALTLEANGTFTYVHGGTTAPNDEFTYTVCDGGGACDTGRVAIRIGDLLFRDGLE